MRVVGVLAGVVVVWMSAAGHVVGGWEKSKSGIGVGMALGAALVVVVCVYAAWAG